MGSFTKTNAKKHRGQSRLQLTEQHAGGPGNVERQNPQAMHETPVPCFHDFDFQVTIYFLIYILLLTLPSHAAVGINIGICLCGPTLHRCRRRGRRHPHHRNRLRGSKQARSERRNFSFQSWRTSKPSATEQPIQYKHSNKKDQCQNKGSISEHLPQSNSKLRGVA